MDCARLEQMGRLVQVTAVQFMCCERAFIVTAAATTQRHQQEHDEQYTTNERFAAMPAAIQGPADCWSIIEWQASKPHGGR